MLAAMAFAPPANRAASLAKPAAIAYIARLPRTIGQQRRQRAPDGAGREMVLDLRLRDAGNVLKLGGGEVPGEGRLNPVDTQRAEISQRPGPQQPPAADQADPVADQLDLGQDVRGEEDRRHVARGHAGELGEFTGQVTDPPLDRQAVAGRVQAEHLRPAAGGPDEIHQQADRGGLPGAVRADENDPVRWLLDAGEPAARWVTLTAILDAGPDDAEVRAAHRNVVAHPATRAQGQRARTSGEFHHLVQRGLEVSGELARVGHRERVGVDADAAVPVVRDERDHRGAAGQRAERIHVRDP
jgi:hypothetical protein